MPFVPDPVRSRFVPDEEPPLPSDPRGGIGTNLLAGALRGASSIGSAFVAPFTDGSKLDFKPKDVEAERQNTLGERNRLTSEVDKGLGLLGADPDSTSYKTGKIGTEIAGTMGIGPSGPLAPLAKSSGATLRGLLEYGKRVVAGAAAGAGASAMIDPESAGAGAAAGAVIPALMPGARAIGGAVSNATGPLREVWRTSQARTFIDRALGDSTTKQKIIQAIQQGEGAGVTTVADDIAAANVGQSGKFGSPLVAMEDKLSRQSNGISDSAKAIAARQEAGRMQVLEGVKPDLAAAVAARKAAASPLYQQADQAVVTMDAPMMSLFDRMPKGTLAAAKDLARVDGRQFQMGKYVPAHAVESGVLDAAGNPVMRQVPAQYPKITGESLHYLKRALSDISNASPATKGIGRDAQAAAGRVLDDFLTAFETKVPAYGAARQTFAGKSVPVNQAKVVQEMQNVLSGQGGPERGAAFQNVLGRGEASLLKRSTGFPRYSGVDQVLDQPQMSAVNKVSSELARDKERALLASNVDINDVVRVAEDGGSGAVSFPTLLNRPAMLTNWVLKKFSTGADERIAQDMGKLMISDPAAFSAKYLQDATPSRIRQIADALMKNYGNPYTSVAPSALVSGNEE